MITKKQITILLAGTFFLQGCTAAMMGTAGALANKAIHEKPALSVSGSSYAAADMLAGQARHMINGQTMIEAAPLKNIGTTETTETLGRVIAEQVASRFVQIGYSVKQVEHGQTEHDISALPVAQNQSSSYRGTAKEATIGGTYVVVGGDILVHLSLFDNSTGRMLATYDYTMDMTRDLRTLSGAEPKITDMFTGNF